MIYKPAAPVQPTEAASAADLGVEREVVTLSYDGQRHEVDKRRVVIGRSKDCDIQLEDGNVSRRHAELRQEGAAYWLIDLDSTNGMEVNGRATRRAKLDDGDAVTLGSTELVFRRELT
jgi:pSer/pThr/pTyr-binding forkhead associated (FHA) protein